MATGGPHDRSPVGTPGGRQNWVDKVGGLPGYIREIAHALMRQGHSESKAIQLAIGTCKNWASGQGNVTAATRAKAAAAIAEWEAKKGASHARSGSVRLSRPQGGSVTSTVDLAPTQAKRDRAKKDGHALPDGSFPIENRSDLIKAIGLAGNAKDPAKARKFICRRAKALGLDNLIPKTWTRVGDYSAPRLLAEMDLASRAERITDPTQRRAARSAVMDLAARWRHGWIPLNAEAVAIASRGGPHGQKSRVAGRSRSGAVKAPKAESSGGPVKSAVQKANERGAERRRQLNTRGFSGNDKSSQKPNASSVPPKGSWRQVSPDEFVATDHTGKFKSFATKEAATRHAEHAGHKVGGTPVHLTQAANPYNTPHGATRVANENSDRLRRATQFNPTAHNNAAMHHEHAARLNEEASNHSQAAKHRQRAEDHRNLIARSQSTAARQLAQDSPAQKAHEAKLEAQRAHTRANPFDTRKWSEIPKDYRSTVDGKRMVLMAGPHGTQLMPWKGPESAPSKPGAKGKGKAHHQPGAQVTFKTRTSEGDGEVVRADGPNHVVVKDYRGERRVHKSFVKPRVGSQEAVDARAARTEVAKGAIRHQLEQHRASAGSASGIDPETGMFKSRLEESRRALQANMARNPAMADIIKRRYTNALARVKELEAKRQRSGFWTDSDARALLNAKRAITEGGKI